MASSGKTRKYLGQEAFEFYQKYLTWITADHGHQQEDHLLRNQDPEGRKACKHHSCIKQNSDTINRDTIVNTMIQFEYVSFFWSIFNPLFCTVNSSKLQNKFFQELPASVVVQCLAKLLYVTDTFTTSHNLKNLPENHIHISLGKEANTLNEHANRPC